MAKKINPDEQGINENTTQDNNIPIKEQKKDVPLTEIPAQVNTILKSFTNYETLYVDKHGGVFTPDTAPGIRGDALLYKNPFFNNSNTY